MKLLGQGKLGPQERAEFQSEIVQRVTGGLQLVNSYGVDAPAQNRSYQNAPSA